MPFEGPVIITDREMLLLAYGAIVTSDDAHLSEVEDLLSKYLFPVETEVQK